MKKYAIVTTKQKVISTDWQTRIQQFGKYFNWEIESVLQLSEFDNYIQLCNEFL
jgi:hypothetical protein